MSDYEYCSGEPAFFCCQLRSPSGGPVQPVRPAMARSRWKRREPPVVGGPHLLCPQFLKGNTIHDRQFNTSESV